MTQKTDSVQIQEVPLEEDPADDSIPPSEEGPDDMDQTTGTELVVVETEDRSEGWFFRFLTQIGLRSKGTLRDDLNEALAGEGDAGDVFSPEERSMLQNILRLRERRVEDVMVPRAEIHAVDQQVSLGDLLQLFEETGHSRMPVYEDTLDDPRGMVLVKDLLLHIVSKSGGKSKDDSAAPAKLDFSKVVLDATLSDIGITRTVIFVPPSMLAADLMARMQATRTQMALVIDEYGGTDGLVSLEDIVEEVVGEIEDEHDDEDDDLMIVQTGDTVWASDARAELEKAAEIIGEAFDPGKHGDDVDTIGGLVFSLAGHIPVRGEVVRGLPGFEFRILDADPRRVRRLEIVQTLARPPRRKGAGAD